MHLPRVRFGGEQALIEVFRVALQCHHVHGGNTGGQLEQVISAGKGQARQAGHYCGAVHQRQGFLGAQHQGLPAQFTVNVGGVAAFAVVHDLTFAR
ncbi:hypothetical protein D3C80_1797390 [compost metagenome]